MKNEGTRFEVAPAASGWAAWWLRDGDGGPVLLGAGETASGAVEHARGRQAAGLAPGPGDGCEHAVVRPHMACGALRRLLDARDAEGAGRWLTRSNA